METENSWWSLFNSAMTGQAYQLQKSLNAGRACRKKRPSEEAQRFAVKKLSMGVSSSCSKLIATNIAKACLASWTLGEKLSLHQVRCSSALNRGSAHHIAKFADLLDLRHGTSSIFQSDNRIQLTAEQKFVRLSNVQQILSTFNHPQTKGLMEQQNTTLST